MTTFQRYGKTLCAGLLCFIFHFLFIFYHVYVDAFDKGLRAVPVRYHEFPRLWHPFLDLNRWDSGHYENIVVNGYRSGPHSPIPPETIQWYPGYPLLAKGLCRVTGLPPTLVFSLLSLSLTLLFWLLFWSPAMLAGFGTKALAIGGTLILCWPGAFYWFAGMTEPLSALLLIALVNLWLSRRSVWSFPLLAAATAVKQPFVPLAIMLVSLERVRSQRGILQLTGLLLVSLTGFIAFGLFGLIRFDDFFASSNVSLKNYLITLDLRSIIDLPHYARHVGTLNGAVAAGGMLALFLTGLGLLNPSRINAFGTALLTRRRQYEISPQSFLWATAMAYTVFIIYGSAYKMEPFMSVFRHQTADICLFLLLACQLKNIAAWKLLAALIPIGWTLIFWQNRLTIDYWLWKWIA